MPSTQPARLYRWSELERDAPMAKLSRRRVVGEHAMLSEISLEKGCHVPTHAHANEQIACVLTGRMRFGIGAEGSPERTEIEVGPGEVLVIPASVPHSADALEDSVVLDVFSPPSEQTGIDQVERD